MKNKHLKTALLKEIYQVFLVDVESQTYMVCNYANLGYLQNKFSISDRNFFGLLVSLKEEGYLNLDWKKEIAIITNKGIAFVN